MVLHPTYPPTLGATELGHGRWRFLVWAPHARQIELKIVAPHEHLLPMQRLERDYYEVTVEHLPSGAEYFYRIDGKHDRPDPASRYQPHGVHRASAVIDPNFSWTDHHWRGLPQHQYVIYELHIGTFTTEGTFDAAIAQLDDLRELGITAIELLPVAQFPGSRNWGYDGVQPFAVQNSYGGPAGLKRFVNAAHERGLAVILDVVYNHLGPEGNYLQEFAPYFTGRYHTPWGQALNFDDRHSDEVRRFFIENALYWIDDCHIDALRLDAVHAIFDISPRPFLQELADAVRLEGDRLNRRVYTIAESGANDPKLLTSKDLGGDGLDAQWSDDLHHALRTELVDDRSGYYADYAGFPDLIKAFRDGFVLDGGRSPFLGRRQGAPGRHIDPLRLVVCSQNHDQVGNRLFGERLTQLATFEQLKLAAATVILSPYQPMLFMGEEYGETAPFQFFISHLDPQLIEAVRRGRQQEFASFQWNVEPPDPQAEETFLSCKLNHHLKESGRHRVLRDFYKRLLQLRATETPLAFPSRERMEVAALGEQHTMLVRSWSASRTVLMLFHYGTVESTVTLPQISGSWSLQLNSAANCWEGPGLDVPQQWSSTSDATLTLAPTSFCVYIQ